MPMPQMIFDQWRMFQYNEYPEDGEWCVCLFGEGKKPPEVFVGGYDEERKLFYANFGLGGAILDQDDCGAWMPIREGRMHMPNDTERGDNLFLFLDEEEVRQFREICFDVGETAEGILDKFAKAVIRDKSLLLNLVEDARNRDEEMEKKLRDLNFRQVVDNLNTLAYMFDSSDLRIAQLHYDDRRIRAYAAVFELAEYLITSIKDAEEMCEDFCETDREKIIAGMAASHEECVPESEVRW